VRRHFKGTAAEIIRKRVHSIYMAQRRRSKKHNRTMNYCEAELLALVKAQPLCRYCQQAWLPKDFEIDHVVPVSRGGSFNLQNLAVAHGGCNRAKHTLLEESFHRLMTFLGSLPTDDAQNIWMRLKAGAAFAMSRWGH
jgi:5-methylcytosine-specific restriction endonuclease McrA